MPRKVRGRPVAYGDAQLRALDTFLREEYLVELSGNDVDLLTDGAPFHENGTAFFDVDHLHVEFLKAHNYKVTARQTSLAMAEIGVHRVQRRFENGTRLRCCTLPVPEGARCNISDAEIAKYHRLRAPGWHGEDLGEPWVNAVKQFELHGKTRSSIRFVKENFEGYDEPKRARALMALHDNEEFVIKEYFEQLRVEHFPDLGGYKINFWRVSYHPKSDMKSIFPNDYYEYLHDSVFDADLNSAFNKPQFVLEYFPDSNGGTPEARAKLVKQSLGLSKTEKSEVVLQLGHHHSKGAA